jgi:hypothetical protein
LEDAMRGLKTSLIILSLFGGTAAKAGTLFEQLAPTPTGYALTTNYNNASFNPATADVTAQLFATSGTDPIATDGLSLGCDAGDYGGGVSGKIVLVSRGSCVFTDKVSLAQAAGALGVLIVENDPMVTGAAGLGGSDAGITIPTFRLTIPLGTELADLSRLGGVTVRMAIGDNLTSDVPEPAAWMMLVSGFGLIGAAMRGHRRRATAVA